MSYILQIKNVWDVCGPYVDDVAKQLLERGYTVGYKKRTADAVVLSVSKKHSADIVFTKHFINNLRIEIDLENYFFRAGKNIAAVPKELLKAFGVKAGCIYPNPLDTIFSPVSALAGLAAAVGRSSMPYDLLDVLVKCFGNMESVEWGNWEDYLRWTWNTIQ